MNEAETARLLAALQVHQTELTTRNEELRRARDELEGALAEFADLYETAPAGYFSLSTSGVILRANAVACRLLRQDRAQLIGARLEPLFSDWSPPCDQFLARAYAGDVARTCCVAFDPGDDEEVRSFELSAASAQGGEQLRVFAVEVTESRRLYRGVSEQEAYYRAHFQRSRDPLMILTPPAWRFAAGNPAALEMFGVADEAQFTARAPWEYSPPLQPDGTRSEEKARQMIARALEAESAYFEWTHMRRDGETFPATVLLTRMEVQGDQLVLASVRDETESKRLQASLAQADRLASMGMLAAGVAHEINNPLGYVLTNIESLVEDLPTLAPVLADARVGEATGTEWLADVMERLEDALEGTQRILDVSRDLRSFARVESGRTLVSVEQAAEAAIAMACNELRFRASVARDFSPTPVVSASEGKLAQVFLNLIVNAAQSFEASDPRRNGINVRTWSERDGVFASVSNNGPPIPEEHLETIFEPFFSTKAAGAGSGLGLAICRNLIEEFGGVIGLTSDRQTGTTVWFRLEAAGEADENATEDAPARAAAVAREGGRVLLIDDEPRLISLLSRLLGPHFEIVVANGGPAGRERLETDRRFDAILCDLMMPELTGMALHEWLAGHDPELAARLIFITGGPFTPDASSYISKAGRPVVDKPFVLAELLALLHEVSRAADSCG